MKPSSPFLKAGLGLLLLSCILFLALPARSQTRTLLSRQDFNAGQIPTGWSSSNNSWNLISLGDSGSNGSLMCNDWYFYFATDPVTTPSVDASNYSSTADSVWVDFDFFWEYNGYVAFGPDTWEVLAGSDILQSGDETDLNTYSNPSDYSNFMPSQSSPTYWTHYHLLVPPADRSSSTVITFEVIPGFGCSNPAIDNVTITAESVPPTITQQPSGETVCAGQSATFSVSATGDNLTYQWMKGGTNISSATGSTYSIDSALTGDAGNYSVTIQGTDSAVTSNAAQLTVNTAPSISTQPSNLTVCTSEPASLSVSASGTNLSYQWQKNGSNISGATASTYSISSAHSSDSATYDVVISGTCSPSVTSNSVMLTVYPPPGITVSLSPTSLWPANHSMKTISATVTTTGHCTPLTLHLLSITSNQSGSGEVGTFASDGSSFHVLADRTGNSDRVYTATYEVTDDAGNSVTTTATVTVPHDHSGLKIADEGSASPIDDGSPSAITVEPNPASGSVDIYVPDLPVGIPASVEVVNEVGNVITTLYNATPKSDLVLSLRWDCSSVPNGTYFVRIDNSNTIRSSKILVNH